VSASGFTRTARIASRQSRTSLPAHATGTHREGDVALAAGGNLLSTDVGLLPTADAANIRRFTATRAACQDCCVSDAMRVRGRVLIVGSIVAASSTGARAGALMA
jgi:hypothetical protein